MSIEIILRLVIMLFCALIGWGLGSVWAPWIISRFPTGAAYYRIAITILFAIIGFLIAPYVTVVPFRELRRRLHQVPARDLVMGIGGCLVGLIIAALLALPLSMLPGIWGQISPFLAAILLGYLGAMILIMRDKDILNLLGLFVGHDMVTRKRDMVVLDTSVIIDGRIVDIHQSGFIHGTMIVPRFVLDELQHIADSPDVLRRNRGRRGLDILNKLQKDDSVPLEIVEMDIPEIHEVDGKLIRLAQELGCPVLTNDYNLNRVAELRGVQVLNINELANAVKVVVLPGETLQVQIIQEGKEPGQGVGYLDDGTMVVVEEGRRYINNTLEVVVTRVLQTVAGRMIFAQIQNNHRRQ
ncbi:MAG: PIN domain nuclease [Chloroflexi bacterium]|nr:PIN domain nuclease [Chloroflexota bacterium]